MPNTVFSFHEDDDALASLLIAFLQGDRQVREELPALIHKKLVNFARRFIPSELAEDAVQQMWLLLLRKDPNSFDPTKVPAWRCLQQLLRSAARDIRAAYTPPGQRTRLYKDANGEIIANNSALSLDDMVSTEDDGGDGTLYELVPDTDDPFGSIDAKIDAELLLNEAQTLVSQPVSVALRWMYEHEAGLEESAMHSGLTRFQLHRGIRQLRRQYELLPVAV
jgi:hypothetical protein